MEQYVCLDSGFLSRVVGVYSTENEVIAICSDSLVFTSLCYFVDFIQKQFPNKKN